ncbi:MAG: GNAT family N-acetyltransferase [Saprospiraceae bacterium]
MTNTIELTQTSTLAYGKPDDSFWEKYAGLWQNSTERSPFQAPRLLRYFSAQNPGETIVFQYFNKQSELLGAALFQQENQGVHFLSDMKTDANFFILHRSCTPDDMLDFFRQFLQRVKAEGWALMLNNQPDWADYMRQFEAAAATSGMYWMEIPYSVCPVVTAETPKALFEQISSSRELRYRVNKLKNQKKAEFEVLSDDTDLEHWAEEFCQAHVLRWEGTPTPSAYRDPLRRQFVKGCMRAWAEDGILVRFSVKTEGRRVGFVIGLRAAESLVHHSTTFHPEYKKFSPGKALILTMAEWMAGNNLRVLDFGDGDEPYKYTVANEEHVLSRIFLSGKQNLPFILKTKLIKWTKEHPRFYNYYARKIKPHLA